MPGLTRTALSAVVWNYCGVGVLVATQIISTAVTARVVAPSEFGAYATAQAVTAICGYFSLTALGNALLRRNDVSRAAVGTAMLLATASGAVVAAVTALSAGFWASLWNVPHATGSIRALAAVTFATGGAVVPLAVLRFRLRFRAAAVTEATTQVVGAAVGVLLAVEMHSALALALGQVCAATLLLSSSAILARRDIAVCFSWSDAKQLLGFATQVNLVNMSSYLSGAAPAWYIARCFGAAALGFYSRASLLAGLPLTYMSSSVMKVLYPLYGRLKDDRERVNAMVEEALCLVTGLGWVAFAFLGGSAPVVVALLLGDRWAGVAPLLSLAAVAAGGDLACGLLTNAGEAFGWMRVIWWRQTMFALCLACGLFAAHEFGLGVEAVVGLFALSRWVAYGATLSAFVRRRSLRSSAPREQLVHLAFAATVFFAAALVARVFGDAAVAIQLLTEVIVGLGTLGTLLLLRRQIPAIRTLERRIALSRATQFQPAALSTAGGP